MKNLIHALICLFLVVPSQAGIIYVDADANGANDGISWADAYNYLQDALADANSNADVNEIWVAQGIYTPDSNSADPNGSGDREATFQLISGVALYGGFPSGGDPNWNDRDPNSYETILSGDLDGNDIDVNDPCDLPNEPTRGENSYRVVTSSDSNAVLDGFIITGGNDGRVNEFSIPIGRGGGMYNDSGSPTVRNCTFRGNRTGFGGGMYNDSGSPTLTNCTFIGNWAEGGGGMYDKGAPTLTNCTFSGNSAGVHGGGMNTFGAPTLTNCTFIGNLAYRSGGMNNGTNSNATLTNCTFSSNSAGDRGGGMGIIFCNTTVTNCIFIANSARFGGGIDNYGDSTLTNCIFTRNSVWGAGGGMQNSGGDPALTNCVFNNNSAYAGGGMSNYPDAPTKPSPILVNCTFSGNTAGLYGGGVLNTGSATLFNCMLTGNSAQYGGGMGNFYGSSVVSNCTFSGNSADYGGGTYEDGSNSTLLNCTLWDNTADIDGAEIALADPNQPSTLTVSYSDVQGGQAQVYVEPNSTLIWGIGNIDADPCFVFPGYWADVNDPNIVVEPNDPNALWVDGDYHLKSEGWRWHTQRKVWKWDNVTSRCIDAGNPGCPLGAELPSVPYDPNNDWGQNLRINMGAYGGTAEASMPPYDWAILADLTNDGTVDINDLAAFVDYWLDSGQCIPSDLDRDQFVDILDFALLAQDWFVETSWYAP